MLILTKWKGRRVLFMTLYILLLLSTVIYLAPSVDLALSLIVFSPVQGSAIVLFFVVISEYSDPKRRILFLIANSAIQKLFYGIMLAAPKNYLLGYFVACMQYFNIILGMFGLWSVYKWPESPYWLASKGRFEEITKAFVDVRGGSESSEELRTLTDARARPSSVKMIYAPLLIALPVLCMTVPNFHSIYGYYNIFPLNDLLTGSRLSFSILQCICNVALAVLTVLITVTLSRKLSFLAYGFLFASNYFVLILFVEMKIPLLALLFEVIIEYGPKTVALPILIELIPQKFVTSATLFISLLYNAMNSLPAGRTLVPPEIFAVSMMIVIIISYIIMPEVKEKSLIEIEQMYLTKKNKPQIIETHL